jgi:acyl carrier protein
MVKLEPSIVEGAIIQELESLKKMAIVDSKIEITHESIPALIGVKSLILVDMMGRLEERLNVSIPNNCYIFRSDENIKDLSIKEAAEKLIKCAEYANK